MEIPCAKDCPDRSITCHGKCERYAAWKKEVDKQRIEERMRKKEYYWAGLKR